MTETANKESAPVTAEQFDELKQMVQGLASEKDELAKQNKELRAALSKRQPTAEERTAEAESFRDQLLPKPAAKKDRKQFLRKFQTISSRNGKGVISYDVTHASNAETEDEAIQELQQSNRSFELNGNTVIWKSVSKLNKKTGRYEQIKKLDKETKQLVSA